MKRFIFLAVFFYALSNACFAVILFSIKAPQDDTWARRDVCSRPELTPFHNAYFDILRTRLLPLNFTDAEKAFGPKVGSATNWWSEMPIALDTPATVWDEYLKLKSALPHGGPQLAQYPADLVLPTFACEGSCGGGMMMMVSGLHSLNSADNNNHTDLYEVGDLGYVELYSDLDGKSVQTAVLYFRSDEKFVPLKSAHDFASRLAWEKSKLNALQKWLDEHLPKLTELGEVEVSASEPKRIDLGRGATYLLTAENFHRSNVTNIFYSVSLIKETPKPAVWSKLPQSISVNHLGDSIGFRIDENYYRMTPKLMGKVPLPNP